MRILAIEPANNQSRLWRFSLVILAMLVTGPFLSGCSASNGGIPYPSMDLFTKGEDKGLTNSEKEQAIKELTLERSQHQEELRRAQ